MEQGADKRLRVEKNINKKVIMLFNLSFEYFIVFMSILLLSSLSLINFSKTKLLVFIVFNAIVYMVVKYLDVSNFLNEYSFKKLPKMIDNDLYRLENEKECKIIRASSHSKS